MNSSGDEREYPTNVETKALGEESGPQQEIKTSNKDTGSLRLVSTKVDTFAECSITNEVSITLTEGAPWEGYSKFEASGETRYSTQLSFSSHDERKTSYSG